MTVWLRRSGGHPGPAQASSLLTFLGKSWAAVGHWSNWLEICWRAVLWERQIHCGLLAACSTVRQLRAMQLSRNIIDVYYVLLSFFARAAQGCPSYHPPPTLWIFSAWCKTISITSHIFYPQLNTFAHFLHRMCHFRGVQCVAVKVGWWPSGPVRRPTSLPTCPQLRPAAAATAHSWASQTHCGNPPEAALFPAKSSWLYHFHLSKQRSMQIRRS